MESKETDEARKARFKQMSSDKRKALIREKMKAEGLEEGSGVSGKSFCSYDRDKILDLLKLTSCLTEMQTKQSSRKNKALQTKRSLLGY